MQELRGKTFISARPHSCEDTITGECITDTTAKKCREICEKSDLCDVAAFSEGVCRPFYTEIYDYVNPLLTLQKSENPNDVVFVNDNLWKFPSDTAGIVNTRDPFYFTTKDNRTIATETVGETLKISDSGFVKTQLIFQDIHGPNGRIEICDSVLINQPGTNLILRSNGKDGLRWEPALSDNTGILDLFTLTPKNQHKCPGNTPVRWSDEYYLEYSGRFIAVRPGSQELYLTAKKSAALLWKLQPRDFKGWYCNDGVCTGIEIEKVSFNKNTARYNGNVVYRTDTCMLQCDPPLQVQTTQTAESSSDCTGKWWWIIAIILFCLVCGLIPVLWVKAKHSM